MAEPFRFRSAVRREISATWGRFARLWIVLAVLVEGFLLVMPLKVQGMGGLGTPTFLFLGFLLAWGPAWLCSDLLSLRFKTNPEPLREWRPVEFLARAAGRLLPFYIAGAVWSGSWTARHLAAEIRGEFSLAFGSLVSDWPAFWIAWPPWALVPLAGGLFLAASAALLSSIFRRPRRVVITLTMLLLGTVANAVVFAMLFGGFGVPDATQYLLTAAALPNLFLGLGLAYVLELALGGANRPWSGQFHLICWLVVAGFLILTLAPVYWVRWITGRRWRRHPHTAVPDVDGAVVPERPGG